MKTIRTLTVLALLVAGGAELQAQPAPGSAANLQTNPPASALSPVPAAVPAAVPPVVTPPGPVAAPGSAPDAVPAMPPAAVPPAANGIEAGVGTPPEPASIDAAHCLRLNFRGASLDMVLNYLSEAAGFIIVLDAQPRGKVDVWSSTPVTKEEAVDLLNSVLNKNGYAAIRKGRTLTIVNKDEAKIRAIPVKLGYEPESIPDNDEMVTQIIPVRYVEVGTLIKDLQPLVSTQTAMTANESGNSIVITDTQSNIRRVAEIIKCIDNGAEDFTVLKVFHLQYSDPQETADLLSNLFQDDSRSGGTSTPVQFGGGGGFARMAAMFGGGRRGGGFGGSSQGGGSTAQNQRIKKRNRVIAVPDPRTASVVVSCTKDLMDQIEGVVAELDSNPAKKQSVHAYKLENSDPNQALTVLQDMFQKNGTTSRNNMMNQNSALQMRSQQQNQQYNMGTGMSSGRMGGSGMRSSSRMGGGF